MRELFERISPSLRDYLYLCCSFKRYSSKRARYDRRGMDVRTYLYRIFKLKEGCTPAEWRAKIAKNVAYPHQAANVMPGGKIKKPSVLQHRGL